MAPVPLGAEISILSSGRHGVGRAGLTGKGLAQLGCSPGSQQAGAALVGWLGAAPGEREGCSVQGWGSGCVTKVFGDKWAVTCLCPWELSSSGLEQSWRCCPGIPPRRRQHRRAAALVPYLRGARRHSEPILSTVYLFSRRAGGADGAEPRGEPAACSVQLRSSCAALWGRLSPARVCIRTGD